MSLDFAVWVLIFTAIVFSNIPWLFSGKLFLFLPKANKSVFITLVEWLCNYLFIAGLAYFLENNTLGNVQQQGWEFYAVTFFMFVIFAFPGFIYRFNLKMFLKTTV